jgi:predicted small lipoprotein YifL
MLKPISKSVYRPMPTTTLKPLCVLLMVTAVTVLAGCGRKGDLVLPDNNQKPPAEKPATPVGQ